MKYLSLTSAEPSARQECYGLLGVCLGQPARVATTAFSKLGDSATGSPLVLPFAAPNTGELCYSWEMEGLDGGTIGFCQENNEEMGSGSPVTQISLGVPSDLDLRLSIPSGLTLDTRDAMSVWSERLTTEMMTEPFRVGFVFGEGTKVYDLAWGDNGGGGDIAIEPSSVVEIGGVGGPGAPEYVSNCFAAGDYRYAYDDLLGGLEYAAVGWVVVREPTAADLTRYREWKEGPLCQP